MVYKYEDVFKNIEVCNESDDFYARGTLERNVCLQLYEARNTLKKAYEETRHDNRDTQVLRSVLKDLDFVIKANSKMER